MVSIIVPIYNAEKSLKDCVKSILMQSYKDYEIILVDDGSTDNSLSICKQLAEMNEQITIVCQKNLGVSSARNNGLEEAKGEFVLFVDADDIIEENMLETIMTKSENDIVICGFKVVGSDLIKNDTATLQSLAKYEINRELLLRKIISTSSERIYGYVWRTLFKMEIIKENSLRFDSNIKISEDFFFLIKAVSCSNKFGIIPDELYNYCINSKSATAKYMPTIHTDMSYVNDWMQYNLCEEYPHLMEGFYGCKANTYLRYVQNLCRSGNPFTGLTERVQEANRVKDKFGYKNVLKNVLKSNMEINLKTYISYWILYLGMERVYLFLFDLKQRKRRNEN